MKNEKEKKRRKEEKGLADGLRSLFVVVNVGAKDFHLYVRVNNFTFP